MLQEAGIPIRASHLPKPYILVGICASQMILHFSSESTGTTWAVCQVASCSNILSSVFDVPPSRTSIGDMLYSVKDAPLEVWT